MKQPPFTTLLPIRLSTADWSTEVQLETLLKRAESAYCMVSSRPQLSRHVSDRMRTPWPGDSCRALTTAAARYAAVTTPSRASMVPWRMDSIQRDARPTSEAETPKVLANTLNPVSGGTLPCCWRFDSEKERLKTMAPLMSWKGALADVAGRESDDGVFTKAPRATMARRDNMADGDGRADAGLLFAFRLCRATS